MRSDGNSIEAFEGEHVLITGGLGFIGSNLSTSLAEIGAHVHIVDSMLEGSGSNQENVRAIKDKLKISKEDIGSSSLGQLMEDSKFVFHLAAQTNRLYALRSPSEDARINYIGTINTLEACRKHDSVSRIVFASSRAVFGDPTRLPVDETHPTHPKDPYGLNKLCAEKACQLYRELYDLPISVLRLSNVYGPRGQLRNPDYGVINLFVGNALVGKPLLVFGSGQQTRDPIYVSDVVNAFERVALCDSAIGETLVVGSGTEVSILDLAKLVVETSGLGSIRMVEFPIGLEKADISRFRMDCSKLKRLAGWSPKVSLEEGIRLTIEFYKENLSSYL